MMKYRDYTNENLNGRWIGNDADWSQTEVIQRQIRLQGVYGSIFE